MYLRTIKVRSSSGALNEYVRVVEAYRDGGKVKQRTLADLGRKDYYSAGSEPLTSRPGSQA